jgi:hypothetical protein
VRWPHQTTNETGRTAAGIPPSSILAGMADEGSLKRLGGGRWQTRDGRFAIEPQSGTWAVVDGERTDELGLPLVRGPFASLTAAKADIDAARAEGEATSPLAERLTAKRAAARGSEARKGAPVAADAKRETAKRAPAEPAWLRSLDGSKRERARALIARLTKEGVEDAEALVRSDLVGGQPALARLAIRRALSGARTAKGSTAGDPHVDVLLEGKDAALGVSWRLVDGEGRAIRRLDQR